MIRGETELWSNLKNPNDALSSKVDSDGNTALNVFITQSKRGLKLDLSKKPLALRDKENYLGHTGLMLAILAKRWESFDFFMNRLHSDISRIDFKGNSVLSLAIKEGEVSMANYLIKYSPKLVLVRNNDGETALIEAVHLGGKDGVQSLILSSPYADVMGEDFKGKTALYYAVEKGDYPSLRRLMRHHSYRSYPDLEQKLLLLALKEGYLSIIEYLIEDYQVSLTGIEYEIVRSCCYHGYVSSLDRFLKQKKISLAVFKKNFLSFIESAVGMAHADMVFYLINLYKCMDLSQNQWDEISAQMVYVALKTRNVFFLPYLEEWGLSYVYKDAHCLPIKQVIESSDIASFDWLLRRGFSLNWEDEEGENVFSFVTDLFMYLFLKKEFIKAGCGDEMKKKINYQKLVWRSIKYCEVSLLEQCFF